MLAPTHAWTLRTLRSPTERTCHRDPKTSHGPHGSLVDMPKSTLDFQFGSIFGYIRDMYVSDLPTNFPIADGKVADMLASTHACTTTHDSLVNFSGSACHRDLVHSPSPRWEFLLTCPIDSHLSIGIDLWFYQGGVRASHACKLPIAPMGDSRFAHYLQGGGVYVSSGTVTITSSSIYGNTASYVVRAHVQKFPSTRWETQLTILLMFAGRRCLCQWWLSDN